MSRLRLQQAPSGDHIGVTGGGGWDGGWEQGDQCGGHYKSLQDTQWFSQGSWGCEEGEMVGFGIYLERVAIRIC